MTDILIRAACFVAIIVLGTLLRRTGFFKKGDFRLLSRIVIRITLPAAFTAQLNGDYELASAVNSFSILFSVLLITAALLI